MLLALWTVAAVIFVLLDILLRYSDLWLFPYGLTWFAFSGSRGGMIVAALVGWLFLLGPTMVCFRESRQRQYAIYYAILAVLLGVNFVGWHRFFVHIGPLLKL